MMFPVDIFHEPVNMKNMMGRIEPCVKHEEVYECLLQQLNEAKLVLFTCPVTIIGEIPINFPQPDSGIEQETK